MQAMPLKTPTISSTIPANVYAGLPIPPIERIRIFSSGQWEEFVLEWASGLKGQYGKVERCGGAGDMGRDVIAFDKSNPSVWDNYQCKHYSSGLAPSDIWVELGKLVYYTYKQEYTYPRKYLFVAPQGAGTKLSNLFRKPNSLKAKLIENWSGHCSRGITSKAVIDLDVNLSAYLQALDFSIFEAVPPLRIIDQHAKTRWYATRFGGGLPERPIVAQPPIKSVPREATYVRSVLDAYGEHLNLNLRTEEALDEHTEILAHFRETRRDFYSAESLRTFSRDTLPPGAFEQLQDELHGGINDEIRADHANGYRRLLSVVKTARFLPITGHALKERLNVFDRGGICHQLANDSKIKWTK